MVIKVKSTMYRMSTHRSVLNLKRTYLRITAVHLNVPVAKGTYEGTLIWCSLNYVDHINILIPSTTYTSGFEARVTRVSVCRQKTRRCSTPLRSSPMPRLCVHLDPLPWPLGPLTGTPTHDLPCGATLCLQLTLTPPRH